MILKMKYLGEPNRSLLASYYIPEEGEEYKVTWKDRLELIWYGLTKKTLVGCVIDKTKDPESES
jgi:hypothetical protein